VCARCGRASLLAAADDDPDGRSGALLCDGGCPACTVADTTAHLDNALEELRAALDVDDLPQNVQDHIGVACLGLENALGALRGHAEDGGPA
jgi:hypothetical protein